MDIIESAAEVLRGLLDAKHQAREQTINLSRTLIRTSANAIRAMHRREWDLAQETLSNARELLAQMRAGVTDYPDLYFAGYMQDSMKEYVEASLTLALLRDEAPPSPEVLNVEPAAYLNGMAEAASELRRYILDLLRDDQYDEAETLLAKMDGIYDLLVTFDFPDAVSGGLRHRTDSLRGVLERTRGDVTLSLRQKRLQDALENAGA